MNDHNGAMMGNKMSLYVVRAFEPLMYPDTFSFHVLILMPKPNQTTLKCYKLK